MTSPMFRPPEHMSIPVDANGDGPADAEQTVGWACWCGDDDCSIACPCDQETCPRAAWAMCDCGAWGDEPPEHDCPECRFLPPTDDGF